MPLNSVNSVQSIKSTKTSYNPVIAWYDATDTTNILNTVGGTVTNGDTISTWRDKTPNANHMVAINNTRNSYSNTYTSIGGTVPTILTSNFTDTGFYSTAVMNFNTMFYIFIVCQPTGLTTTGYSSIISKSNVSPYPIDRYGANIVIGGNSGVLYESFGSSFNLNTAKTTPQLLVMYGNQTQYMEFLNGTQIVNISHLYYGDGATQKTYLSNRPNGGNTAGSYYLFEVAVYNSDCTSIRQKIEGWLAWKWKINTLLPVGHPYYSSAPSTNPITV
jgi:hypothetical protein